MRRRLRQLAVFTMVAATGSGALAFSLLGLRWPEPTATFRVGMAGASPSGVAWSTALQEAMEEWNGATDFTFVADPAYGDPCLNMTGVNRIDFRSNVCGTSFGGSTLAVTLTLANPGQLGYSELYQSNILFNSAFLWDVYDGPRRSRIDFRRVALHELGHALGLDHENLQPAIMAPAITDVYSLQPDDIAGVNAIYNGTGACLVRDVSLNESRHESLASGDCRVMDLFGGSDDDSFVDVYRLRLERTTTLDIAMSSSELDPVIILSNSRLGNLEIYPVVGGACNASVRRTLPAGDYRILANTYVEPTKCGGNTGGYRLTISDTGMPVLGAIRNASGGALANAAISGGATADGGTSFATNFGADQNFDVVARIAPDAQHVGQAGHIYVIAMLSDGRQFMRDAQGNFMPWSGALGALVPTRSGVLSAVESVPVATDFQASAYGLAGQMLAVYVGYALAPAPQQIWYGSAPIRVTIAPQ